MSGVERGSPSTFCVGHHDSGHRMVQNRHMGDQHVSSAGEAVATRRPLVRLGTLSDVAAVRSLESRYFVGNLTAQQQQGGFISALQPEEWFEQVATDGGLHVAIEPQHGVVGFIVVAPPPQKRQPSVSPIADRMVELADTLEYGGRPISSYKYALRGPVCIDERVRGVGLYDTFNVTTKAAYSSTYEIGMLFVSAANPRSLRTTTTKLKATPLAGFEVGGNSYHFLVYELGIETTR